MRAPLALLAALVVLLVLLGAVIASLAIRVAALLGDALP